MDWYWILRSRKFRIGIICFTLIFFIIFISVILSLTLGENLSPLERAEKLLTEIILFDGHNDFPTNVRSLVNNDLRAFNFSINLSEVLPFATVKYSRTDLYRLRIGRVKAQFWVARAECNSQFKDAVEITLEQIDLIKRLISNYSDQMSFATSHAEILEAVEENKIASLITVCCGHSIQWSFGILRLYYELGVRALTLSAAQCSTPWIDSAIVDSPMKMKPWNSGLGGFGEEIVVEMNRLGMIIDLSESSMESMKDVLRLSQAPVIFSHSGVRSICRNEKNIPDDVLKIVRQRDALVMITFYPTILRCNDGENVTIEDVIAHLDHIRSRTTIDNIGIGSDFDAVDVVTEGLEDVSKFPNLFAALLETGRWTEDDLNKIGGLNMLRVIQEVEEVRDKMADWSPKQQRIKLNDLKKVGFDGSCSTTESIAPPQAPFDLGKFIIQKQ